MVFVNPSKPAVTKNLPRWKLAPDDAAGERHRSSTSQHLTVINAAFIHALRAVMCDAENYQRVDDSPYPTAILKTLKGSGYAQLRPVEIDDHKLLPSSDEEALNAQIWEQRKELSDFDADALDLLCCAFLASAKTRQGDAQIAPRFRRIVSSCGYRMDDLVAYSDKLPARGGE